MNNKLLILIVDDMKDNRLALKIALKKENYLLHEAVNGEEAVTKCKELKPDVILMDAMMPTMDGYAATKTIRKIEEFSRTPILMVTALSEKDDKIKALEAGVNDFISKPFNKHELIARCKSYTNLSRINKQYILASKNPHTNLPNKSALIDNIKLSKNPKILLFKIEDHELLEEFYTEKVVKNIEYKFAKKITIFLNKHCEDATLHHTNDGEFAILKDCVDKTISNEFIYESCMKLYHDVKRSIISLDNYNYDISIVISFAHGDKNLLENARIGLNHAIKCGKNIVFANDIIEEVHKNAKTNIEMIQVIKIALEKQKVVSYFQPLFNNTTKKIEKYESLVRIIKEDEKVLSPFFFLDIAKKGRYYSQITQRVIHNSFKALQETTKDISINLAASDIENQYSRDLIINFLDENPNDAPRVVFELLEDENFKDFVVVTEFITKVKSYGVKIAIDDFGAGYSNFERLLDFQPDILKIDGSLIKNIEDSVFSRNIVETIQSFATKMGIKTVAEFVSNEAIFNIVNEIGIDYSQGYFIDEPQKIIKK